MSVDAADSILVFQKPLYDRVPEWVAATVWLGLLLTGAMLAAVCSAFLILVLMRINAVPVMEAVTAVNFLLFASLAWRLARGRFRLAILCGPQTVQVGRGPARVVRRYEEVFLIYITDKRRSVRLSGDQFSAEAPLTPEITLRCAELLFTRCPYASLADASGIRSLPWSSAEAGKSLTTLARHLRAQAAFQSFSAIVICLGLICMLWTAWRQGWGQLNLLGLKLVTTFSVAGIVGAASLLRSAARKRRQAMLMDQGAARSGGTTIPVER